MKNNSVIPLFIHLLMAALVVTLFTMLLPDLKPFVKQAITYLMISVVSIEGISLWRKQHTYVKVSRLVFYSLVSTVLLFLLIHYITAFTALVDAKGIESVLMEFDSAAKFIFIIICFFQPILLPLPEAVTVPAGSAVFGSFTAAYLSYIGTISGIAVMFFIARAGGKKLVNKKHLWKYQEYTAKSETAFLFLLFIFPILPDEIICIGAGLGSVSIRKFLMIASLSKLITSILLAYSVSLAGHLSLEPAESVLLLSIILAVLYTMTIWIKRRWINDSIPSLKSEE